MHKGSDFSYLQMANKHKKDASLRKRELALHWVSYWDSYSTKKIWNIGKNGEKAAPREPLLKVEGTAAVETIWWPRLQWNGQSLVSTQEQEVGHRDTYKRAIVHSSCSAAVGLGLQLRARRLVTTRKVLGSIPSTAGAGAVETAQMSINKWIAERSYSVLKELNSDSYHMCDPWWQ